MEFLPTKGDASSSGVSTSASAAVAAYWLAGLLTAQRLKVFTPQPEVVSNEIPERARSLLVDALAALHAPSVCIMGAGSAVDAMLKAKGYKDGSLYKRIDQAAEAHLITAEVAAWAHEVRLRANDERHADDEAPLPSTADARRVVDFAIALGEILYVLPARVAAGRKTTQAGESGSIPIAVPLTLPEPHEKIADGQQPSRKLRARVWVGGTSPEATMSLKATARARLESK